MAWHCKEVVRSIRDIDDPALAVEFVERLGVDLQDESCPPELNQLGRTIVRWSAQIAAWHRARVSNGPTTAGWVDWYNNRRLHSTLDYLTPVEFEQAHYATLTRKPQPV